VGDREVRKQLERGRQDPDQDVGDRGRVTRGDDREEVVREVGGLAVHDLPAGLAIALSTTAVAPTAAP